MTCSGANLALLLLGGFRALASAATEELTKLGHEDFRPAHEFAMRAIASGAVSASELGRRLSISKQAAAKTIALLQQRGYVGSDVDADDARRKKLYVTELGFEVMATGEGIFDELRKRWGEEIGCSHVEDMERCLTKLLEGSRGGILDPTWLSQDD